MTATELDLDAIETRLNATDEPMVSVHRPELLALIVRLRTAEQQPEVADHYMEAERYLRLAEIAEEDLGSGVARSYAAIAQVHATLAANPRMNLWARTRTVPGEHHVDAEGHYRSGRAS